MKKVYGNHLGIVINTNDPENRGRIQIFIPHISATLFKKWNETSVDVKNIKHINDIPIEILNRLRLILPWAECAAPIFGGSTGNFHNQATGITGINMEGTV